MAMIITVRNFHSAGDPGYSNIEYISTFVRFCTQLVAEETGVALAVEIVRSSNSRRLSARILRCGREVAQYKFEFLSEEMDFRDDRWGWFSPMDRDWAAFTFMEGLARAAGIDRTTLCYISDKFDAMECDLTGSGTNRGRFDWAVCFPPAAPASAA
jgi:hypothetical protein